MVFTEGATALGSSTLDSSGRAFLVVTMARGTHVTTADYSGSPTYLPSTATTQVDVTGIATTTTMTVGKTVVKAGKPLSVSVTVDAAGNSLPTGMVRLYDGVEPVGTAATLSSGKATIVWTPVAKGSRSLTVRVCRRRPACGFGARAGDGQGQLTAATPTVRVATGSPAARQAANPPTTSVARRTPSLTSASAAREEV